MLVSHNLCFKSKSAVSKPEFADCMQMQQSTEYMENPNLERPHGENVVKLIEAFFSHFLFTKYNQSHRTEAIQSSQNTQHS